MLLSGVSEEQICFSVFQNSTAVTSENYGASLTQRFRSNS